MHYFSVDSVNSIPFLCRKVKKIQSHLHICSTRILIFDFAVILSSFLGFHETILLVCLAFELINGNEISNLDLSSCSQLLPHAANIVRLITKYFEIAKLSTMRTKVYGIVQQLLTSMGVGR